MERQQLLKASERSQGGAGCSRPRGAPAQPPPGRRCEPRGAFLTMLTELFGKKHRSTSSFICDVVLACFLVFSFVLLLDCPSGFVVQATPVISEKQLSTFHLIPSARNIRHLPCISRRTKEEGICMFAIDCLKANGTHLGTCIDRFYFGSCCQIPDYIDASNENNIEDNTIFGQPIKKPIESIKNDQASASPTTILTQKPTVSLKTQSTTSGTTHYITKKPSTTAFHQSIASVRFSTTTPATKKPIEPALDRTDTSDKTQILPVMKPSRFNTTATNATTTHKPFHLATKPTKQPNVTTASTIQSTIYINNQLYNATKPAFVHNHKVSSKPDSVTEIPMKISTFQTVQGSQESTKATTQKPTSYATVKRPSSPQKPESQLPFGTRLPSTTASPQKPTTVYIKPSYTRLNQTTRPSSTYTSTYTSTHSSTHLSTHSTHLSTHSSTISQKPVKPTVALKPIPEKPVVNATKPHVTLRPSVQRPINSTLSNRRTTTRPTTVLIKRPSLEPTTHKPLTTAYKPSPPKPSSQKPPSRPNTTVHNKPTPTKTTTMTTTTTTQKITQSTALKIETTTAPPRIATNTTFPNKATIKPSERPTKKPVVSQTTVKPIQKPTTSTYNATRLPNITTTTTATSKPTSATKKPVLKPTQQSSVKPITTSVNPLTNEVDGPIVIKTTVETQKPTTEKLGLVTWSNYNEAPVTPPATINTTIKEDGWSPGTPLGGWVLIPTVTPALENITGPTMQPSNTIPPPKKPIVAKPTNSTTQIPLQINLTDITSNLTKVASTTEKPILNATTIRITSTTNKPEVTNMIFTVEVSTKQDNESMSENSTTTPLDEQEFSTFMFVSSGPTEPSTLSLNETSILNITTTSSVLKFNDTTSNVTTTPIPSDDNSTTIVSDTLANSTISPEGTLSTEKSTVSPIEGITSTGSPIASADSLNMTDFTDVCGRRLWPEARIVGGSRASFGKWPWQISLRQWRTSTYLHKCGAALLNENWAITAAHCVDSVPPSDLLLRLGEHDLASEEEPFGFQERRVQIVASHPQFDPRTFEYDLALLRFYEPVTFQPNILPVCVPTDDNGFIGETAYVTGWGRLYEDGPLPSVLQEVSVPVIENAACESMYRNAGYIEHIPNIFICAGWRKGGFDSCEGDSGGPMVLQRPSDKRFLLAGVISWGIGCAEPNQPGVYTRISQFRHWINQILQF